MLKIVGANGVIMLGKRFAGRCFLLEEHLGGKLVLLPIPAIREPSAARQVGQADKPGFHIAVVDEVVIPGREDRNSKGG